jgi:hypothetical protein
VTTAQNVVDTVESEAALVEQALPLDRVEWLPVSLEHAPHSLGRRKGLGGLAGASTQAADRGKALFRSVALEVPVDAKDFLARVATHILAFEGESKVTFFDGNLCEYQE